MLEDGPVSAIYNFQIGAAIVQEAYKLEAECMFVPAEPFFGIDEGL